MRLLFLLQGPPGSGKSSFIKENALEPYTIEVDKLRLMFGAPILKKDGEMEINQKHSKRAWDLLDTLLEARMANGETTVVDATHCNQNTVKRYRSLVDKYNYEAFIVKFDVPLETMVLNNENREPYKKVPKEVIERMAQEQKFVKAPWAATIKPEEFQQTVGLKYLMNKEQIAQYKKVVHFGDLQGTYEPVKIYFERNPERSDYLYVFCGDYVDRGQENHLAVDFCLSKYKKPNFIFLEGNHEHHLRCWSKEREIVSEEFLNNTKPQLEQFGISKKETEKFCRTLKPALLYVVSKKEGTPPMIVTVTHAGLSTSVFPYTMALLPNRHVTHGVGEYEWDVDQGFEKNEAPAQDLIASYQVHGHRNAHARPLSADQYSFNLEASVEFGGHLRIAELDLETNKWSTMEIKNDKFNPDLKRYDVVVKPLEKSTLVKQLRTNHLICEKPQGMGISSFNFKREAFFGGHWNEQTVKARGLFVDTETGEIVARSYDKFFNLNEREETQEDGLARRLKFPVRVSLKENGFLGIVGWSKRLGMRVTASKSTLHHEYADMFRELLNKANPSEEFDSWLKEGHSAVFEVIHPEKDPHIVAYSAPCLVLLDTFKNELGNSKLPDEETVRIAKLLNVGTVVQNHKNVINTPYELNEFLQTVNMGYHQEGENIEGFVLEDSAGFMLKIKTKWYDKWKRVRVIRYRLLKGNSPHVGGEKPEYREFLNKIVTHYANNPHDLELSIPQFRKKFLEIPE